MTVWFFLDSSTVGGIESHVLQLAHGLQQYNIPCTVIFYKNHTDHPLYLQLKSLDIPYYFLEKNHLNLLKKIKNDASSVIHTHGYKAGVIGRTIGKLFRIPCISTFHAGEKPAGKVGIYDWIDRITAPLAKKIICVSDKVSERIPAKSLVVNNFVNTAQTEPSCGTKIAFVGRLSHEKGPDIFLQLAREHHEKKFHIYGDGPLADQLKTIATTNVKFHGMQDNMDPHWKNIGILVITSRYEGLPMAAIEAMSRGIPVISFDVGAIKDLIKSNTNGWIAENNNLLEISLLLQNWTYLQPEKKIEIKKSAIRTIEEKYSTDAMLPIYLSIYHEVIANKPFLKTLVSRRDKHEHV